MCLSVLASKLHFVTVEFRKVVRKSTHGKVSFQAANVSMSANVDLPVTLSINAITQYVKYCRLDTLYKCTVLQIH
jgi:hypothetical protein